MLNWKLKVICCHFIFSFNIYQHLKEEYENVVLPLPPQMSTSGAEKRPCNFTVSHSKTLQQRVTFTLAEIWIGAFWLEDVSLPVASSPFSATCHRVVSWRSLRSTITWEARQLRRFITRRTNTQVQQYIKFHSHWSVIERGTIKVTPNGSSEETRRKKKRKGTWWLASLETPIALYNYVVLAFLSSAHKDSYPWLTGQSAPTEMNKCKRKQVSQRHYHNNVFFWEFLD